MPQAGAPRLQRRPDAFEEKLARLVAIAKAPAATPEVAGEIRAALADADPTLCSKAASLADAVGDRALVPDLVATFQRLSTGEQPDRACKATLAVVRALSRLEADAPEVYVPCTRLVRRERVGAGFEDVAAPIRVEAAIALVRTGARDAPYLVAPLLADPEPTVRAGAAQALAASGDPSLAPLLHLRLLVREPDADVVAACLAGLLALSADRYLSYVGGLLDEEDTQTGEVAAVALGDSRRPEAFAILRDSLERPHPERTVTALMLALALLRAPQATEHLVRVLETGTEAMAASAAAALALQKYDGALAERVRAIAAARALPRLTRAVAEGFDDA